MAVPATYRRQSRSAADLEQAIDLYRRALAIQESALGPQHPQVAGTMSNLANAVAGRYSATGDAADLKQAIDLYQAALKLMPRGGAWAGVAAPASFQSGMAIVTFAMHLRPRPHQA